MPGTPQCLMIRLLRRRTQHKDEFHWRAKHALMGWLDETLCCHTWQYVVYIFISAYSHELEKYMEDLMASTYEGCEHFRDFQKTYMHQLKEGYSSLEMVVTEEGKD